MWSDKSCNHQDQRLELYIYSVFRNSSRCAMRAVYVIQFIVQLGFVDINEEANG